MDDDEKPVLISVGLVILSMAIKDRPYLMGNFDLLMENTVEIEQFYKVAVMAENIWIPEFNLN